ncbi:hypothetical protein PFICI_08574 [Pestalotiopsis fici W106-1]|uniref:PPPDE domain-containing protein n=1 Tax=Pestalotiopsis fici (strain W106-1 / CGMCC3.15140) TaxID=1229662 RepID=W3X0R6_PESFW|nr:uncharacterized protein PFICI_08574 [Pestalotiopsis fici W106-1]ETS78721.1 hypothetical protein PFICI_08574 [Pestalotiopsis fici W106-1]
MVNIIAIIIPIFVIFFLLAFWLKCSSRGRKFQEKRLRFRAKVNPFYRAQYKAYQNRLQAEVEKRNIEERDTTKGTPVWFSRHIYHGALQHWVMYINETKYELRRDIESGTYRHNIQNVDWDIKREKREAALQKKQIPDVDGFYICLIGWTRLSEDVLEEKCRTLMQNEFDEYNLFWNNCQHFLKQFADKIISTKALDWAWFRENTKTEYQNCQQLPKPPDALVQMQINTLHHNGHSHAATQLQNSLIAQQQMMNGAQMTANGGLPPGFVGGLPPGAGGITG